MNKETKTEAPTKEMGGALEELKEFGDIVNNHTECVVSAPVFILFAIALMLSSITTTAIIPSS